MGIFDSITNGVRDYFDKKAEDRKIMEQLDRESNLQRRKIFEEEYKKNALEVSKALAKREAAEKSGLARLRATSRARNLERGGQQPGSFFQKMAEYTQKNITKRQENLSRTEEMRQQATNIKQEKVINNIRRPFEKNVPLGKSTWKM